MATLYVRNIPAELYAELQRWAEQHDRSINAEIIDLLQREAARRGTTAELARSLAAYYEQYGDQPVEVPDVVELIHEGRERAWLDEYET